VREFLNSARLAREFGNRKQSSQFVRAALMCRFAAHRWRERPRDAVAGMRWWNSLTETERAAWMARAGNTGRASDAWDMFKGVAP